MKQFCLVFSVLLCAAGLTRATPISIIEQATANGFLDGTSFTGALVTLTFTGDTSNIVSDAGFLTINGTGTMFVAGVGGDAFQDIFEAYSIPASGRAGFQDVIVGSSVVLETESAALDGYGLTTSIGPVVGLAGIATGESFATATGGTFGITAISVINDNQTSTYTATVGTAVPEPGSFLLLGAGIAGLAAFKLRRKPLAQSHR